MAFFKLPSLFSRHSKADADDLEKLFMLPEQQLSSAVSEKNISVAASPQKNSFKTADGKQEFFTAAEHPLNLNPPASRKQNASVGTAAEKADFLPVKNNERTKSFQTQSISQNNIVSLQNTEPAPPPEKAEQETFFSTAKYTQDTAEKSSRKRSRSDRSGQTTEFSHSGTKNSSSKETPFEHIPSDSAAMTNSGNFLQMNSNLNTLTNYAKNQLRYLKKNCELLQNQNRNQTFN